jgi:RND family efflux transporter MFP subunit
MKYSRALGSALVLAGFSGWMVTADWKVQASAPESSIVETTDVKEEVSDNLFQVITKISQSGTLSVEHSYIGRLSAPDTLNIVSQVSGTVRRIQVSPGQIVDKGDILFHVESDTLTSRLQKAQSSVRESQENYESIKRLVTKRFASLSELNASKTDLDEAASDLKSLEEERQQSTIRATVTGALPLDLPKEGDYVSSGSVLAELAKVSDKKVRVLVPPSMANLFRLAKSEDVTVWVRDQSYKGEIQAISSILAADGASIAIDVKAVGSQDQLAGEIAHIKIVERVAGVHRVAGNQVEINTNGEPVVKIVQSGLVSELPAKAMRHSKKGLIIQGWPEQVEMIVRGGGFVSIGEKVSTSCEGSCNAGS